MTPDEQRIAICEVLGWELMRLPGRPEAWDVLTPNGELLSEYVYATKVLAAVKLPPLTLDLLHEAEKKAFDGDADAWTEYLELALPFAVGDKNPVECATATQRAEALLRTLGKYPTEQKP